jgi:hypothetical protein
VDSEAIQAQKQEAKARAGSRANAALRRRQRPPAGDEDLHDDLNMRVALDNDSSHIAIEARGIDLTEDATEWRRYTNLSAPDPLPGYRQRWIRVRLTHKNDPTNVYRKFREGWRPRPASSVPEGYSLPTIQLGQFGECIGVEDMILCQMPEKVFQQMRKHYQDRKRKQTDSTEVELDALSRTHGVKIYRRKVTRAGRRPPLSVADD